MIISCTCNEMMIIMYDGESGSQIDIIDVNGDICGPPVSPISQGLLKAICDVNLP